MVTLYDTVVYLDGKITPEVKHMILIGSQGKEGGKTIFVRLELHNTKVGLVHKRSRKSEKK